ncbi:signal transduction protein [Candidatus Magnetobacterium bavaricum]|uniref:Signal transduction protein n=1 Tax=Candidatus Magnetobacterium bavaricum TaxID=29290 RepID=A0A0F3H0U9_9BACT|nr:signal transduction protein [Candidatus Magnetobacterium bavaricum]
MDAHIQSIAQKVRSLPPLPETIIKIQQVCNDSNSGLKELSKVVEHDPMLTANLLRHANSPSFGFSGSIKSVEHAVAIFGMTVVFGFALASAVRNSVKINLSPYGVTPAAFIDSSQLQSALMYHWYYNVDKSKLDVLVPAAFINEVGKIVIAAELITSGKKDDFQKEIKNAQDEDAIYDLERRFIGTNNLEVSADIFEHWRLAKSMITAIRASLNPLTATDEISPYAWALKIVRTAVLPSGKITAESVEKAAEHLYLAGLEPSVFRVAAARMRNATMN